MAGVAGAGEGAGGFDVRVFSFDAKLGGRPDPNGLAFKGGG
jgi:hypothetical protein